MTFKSEHAQDFLTFVEGIKGKIMNMEGCLSLDILRDKSNTNIFFTYSKWESEIFLEKYRESEFFVKVWSSAKVWFSDKPQAWTVENVC